MKISIFHKKCVCLLRTNRLAGSNDTSYQIIQCTRYSGWEKVLFIRNICYLENVFCFRFANNRFCIIFHVFFLRHYKIHKITFPIYNRHVCFISNDRDLYVHTSVRTKLVEHFSFSFKKCLSWKKSIGRFDNATTRELDTKRYFKMVIIFSYDFPPKNFLRNKSNLKTSSNFPSLQFKPEK